MGCSGQAHGRYSRAFRPRCGSLDAGAGRAAPGRGAEAIARRRLFVPGRLCLFGEHSDWAGGYRRDHPSIEPGRCLIVGTDQGLFASAGPAEAVFELHQLAPDGSSAETVLYPARADTLRGVAEAAGFDSYAAGVACLMLERHPGLGLRLEVQRRTLPLKKGLSSSAAICVLTARAFNLVHGLGLTIEDEMELAYQGEILTGSSCGRMDQACAFGSVPVVLTFDGDHMGVRRLKPDRAVEMLIVDLRNGKDTRLILSSLNSAFLAGDAGIREALGSSNGLIVDTACRALEEGDAAGLGALMTEAQQIFDEKVAPCCPEQLSSPKLHAALSHPAARRFAFGGKGVGSQGDGSAQFVCRDDEARKALASALENDFGVACLNLTIQPVS